MIVIGARGFAKELLEVLVSSKYNFTEKNLLFFDNINNSTPDYLFERFRVLKSFDEVSSFFNKESKSFCLGLGYPKLRKELFMEFVKLGGEAESVISLDSKVGSFGTRIGIGTTVIGNAIINVSCYI